MFKVTEVRIYPAEKTEKHLKAIANVTLDNAFAIRGIKILDGDRGVFIGMPSKKDKNGDFKDIAHPINAQARKILSDAIIREYNKRKDNTK